MRPLVNYHVHTTFSCDATATMREQCLRAVELGLTEVAFTEHLDLQPNEECYGYYNRDAYEAEFRRCEAEFGGSVKLLRGLEMTYQQEFHDQIVNWIKGYPYDFIIGSVHVVKSEFLHLRDLYSRWNARDCYTWYYEELLRAAQSGLFSVLGHLDLPKRYSYDTYGPVSWRDFEPLVNEVLRAAAATGTGIEINTSGLASAAKETFPGPDVVQRFRELGGVHITIGSDAHRPEQLGFGLDEGLRLARNAGFTAVTTYEGRRPRLVPIED